MSKESLVKLNTDELDEFIKHIINNNQYLQSQGKIPVSIEVIGESGIGKTSSIKQLAESLDLDFVKLNLAQIEEIGDLVGFPIRQHKVINKENDEVNWINDNDYSRYEKQSSLYNLTGITRMSYSPPEWIADKQGGGILLLDDWNRADLRFIQAVMELVDRQQYISWSLPKNWHIILTANPDNGDYLVSSIDNAQKTRFISTELKFDVECWARWAEKEGIDGRCINFLLSHPELINDKVNSRSASMFFNSISSLPSFENDLPLIQMIGEGSVGAEFSSVFTTFINNRLDKLISPKNIIEKDESYVFKTLKGTIGTDNDYRADIASILSTRVINYLKVFSQENKVTPDIVNRVTELSKSEIFSNDIVYNMVKSIYNISPAKFKGMLKDPVLVKYIMK